MARCDVQQSRSSVGITAIELDGDGNITRFTTIYNSFQLKDAAYQALVLLGAEK